MSTHQQHLEPTTYFVTFTCYKWLPLFELANSYKSVYNWFEIIKSKGAEVLDYVIMPNHVHCLIHIGSNSINLNKLVSNGKRFMAYEIIKVLKEISRKDIVTILKNGVSKNEQDKGKKHQVFRLSFDAKPCFDAHMLEQKLYYIHGNPVNGQWNLVDDYVNYEHSSASYYEQGKIRHFEIKHYKSMG